MTEILAVFLGACLVNNLILSAMLGLAPALSMSKRLEVAMGMSLAMMLVCSVSTALSQLVKQYVLMPLDAAYLQLISFILSIALGSVLTLKVLQRYRPALGRELTLFLPLVLSNTAVLGLALLSAHYEHDLLRSLFFGLGAAAGFGLVLIMLSAIQERTQAADIPAPFKGSAIMLITLGILSMAFMGFAGIGSE